ncbi:DUF2501 domain-containing protein [Sphingomonas abietis]|uniref:DUF2501 domain-containing protein n=1 Tax=Sphingomonas abietis TaxID=3012344 RepID=A0ABY7NN73_9SPHN|nr:DUF2501 domain-containing protein [Sphingomonas abietis]WBO22093.1 DUF2501 domain-containing protein [Sphingomonas abietis]
MTHRLPILAIAFSLCVGAPASAQLSGLGSLGGGALGGSLGGSLGGLSGLGGGAGLLSGGVSSIGAGNAAGLLGYCVKRKLLGGGDAASVLGRLTGQKGVTGSKGYAAGQDGQIVTQNGAFSLDGVKDKVKGKVCNMVLDHAQSFLPH